VNGKGHPMSEPEVSVAAMVAYCESLLRPQLSEVQDCSGLIVGCGTGDEVVYLSQALGAARVLGVDVDTRFSALARARGCVLQADASCLPFPSEAFAFAAAFHSLEHVGDARAALKEIYRVLRPGAWFYAGVPNRTRLAGYLGSFDASLGQKIYWNLKDWAARARGEFRNEAGAHAGFERRELLALLGEHFRPVELKTEEFLRFKYARRLPAPFLNLLLAPQWIDYCAPAHYAFCQKPKIIM
jgi:SAM-dependent methyltransferase